MFELSRRSPWLESFRVPATQSMLGDENEVRARWLPSGRAIGWPIADAARPLERYTLGSIPIYSRGLAKVPPGWGTGWEPQQPVTKDGHEAGFVWRARDGSIYVPFDPDDAIVALLSEAYLAANGRGGIERAKGIARKAYYRVRPLMPRKAQLRVRRAFSRFQASQRFPRWPVETALHDFHEVLLTFCGAVAGEPLPWLAPWPRPFSWALVLTHDVETSVGYSNIRGICEQERELGFRSCWNFVPRRDYVVEDAFVAELRNAGWEVGVHGLHHDGRDLQSAQLLEKRLPEMREWAGRWLATGFRSPATQRDWSLMPLLGFDYDSSYPDTDPFEPQGGGCCSWLPFFNAGLVELPITLPQDHTLFVILEEHDARVWLEKACFLRARGGMALLDTHPDYLLEERVASAYHHLLASFADDQTAWAALPSQVATWWRRRAETRIERSGDGWRLVGPAAGDACLAFAPAHAA